MGRPPKSRTQHETDGTFRKDRHAGLTNDGDFAGGLPRMPDDFGLAERGAWRHITRGMPKDALRRIDYEYLVGTCRWYGQYVRIMEELRTKKVTDMPYGKLLLNATIAWKQFATGAQHFGASPSARAKLRLVTTAKADDDPLDMLAQIGASRN